MSTIARSSLITWVPFKDNVPIAYEDLNSLKEKLTTMFGDSPFVLTKKDIPVLKAWREVGFEYVAINELIEAILIHDQIQVTLYESLFYTAPKHDDDGN